MVYRLACETDQYVIDMRVHTSFSFLFQKDFLLCKAVQPNLCQKLVSQLWFSTPKALPLLPARHILTSVSQTSLAECSFYFMVQREAVIQIAGVSPLRAL